ncbi:MAG: LytTR family transcriptional regulator [Oscillospiraceae bacterium]|nr:LytTR family transcriptional regulator [Oscillospiraceae bacterium]
MKFRLILATDREEEIVVTAQKRTPLIDRIEQLVSEENTPDSLAGYDETGIRMLAIPEIEALYAEQGKTFAAYSDGKRYRVKKRLYELEALLPEAFVRLNKSCLANRAKIVRYRARFSGAVDAEFRSGYSDYVSRRCFAELKRRYDI